jgi:hypothetical protein
VNYYSSYPNLRMNSEIFLVVNNKTYPGGKQTRLTLKL